MPRSLTDLAGPITTLTRALVGAPDTLITPRLALTLSVRISLQVYEGCEHVLVDTVILSLCLREGLSNCLKYREEGSTEPLPVNRLELYGMVSRLATRHLAASSQAWSIRFHCSGSAVL